MRIAANQRHKTKAAQFVAMPVVAPACEAEHLLAPGRADRNQQPAAVGKLVRYSPPQSPDLNPIEPAVAKFKKLPRDAADHTNQKLWQRCGLFTEIECRSCLRNCGYRYS